LEGLAQEDVGIFYGHLVHFTVFCYIYWTFGIVRGNLVYISRFGILYHEKSGNPDLNWQQRNGVTAWKMQYISQRLDYLDYLAGIHFIFVAFIYFPSAYPITTHFKYSTALLLHKLITFWVLRSCYPGYYVRKLLI
jgi:hypothetical protein